MSLFKNDLKQFKADAMRKRELLATLGVSRSKTPADRNLKMPVIKGLYRDRPKIASLEPSRDRQAFASKLALETQVKLNRVRLTPVDTHTPTRYVHIIYSHTYDRDKAATVPNFNFDSIGPNKMYKEMFEVQSKYAIQKDIKSVIVVSKARNML